MQGYIDTHCHVAWDIDDGMQSIEEAEEALKNASRDGITALIATPHFIPGIIDKNMKMSMNGRIEDLIKLGSTYGIEVYQGCEFFMNYEYLDALDEGFVNTLADSNYLLIEFDVRKNIKHNDSAEDMLYELLIRKYIPIIAHAERYFHDGIDLHRIKEWISMGCYIQVNRTSLLGHHGYTEMKNAEALLRKGLAHVVASDAHASHGNRVCMLSDVYDVIKNGYGEAYADILMKRNPNHILHNEELEELPAMENKSLFKKLWKRGK